MIELFGFESAVAKMLGLAAEVTVVGPEAERKAAEPILASAEERVPVLSGDLKNTLRIEQRDGHWCVLAGDDTVAYAVFVEFAPDNEPFMRPAADDGHDEAIQTISEAIATVLL